MGATTYQFVHLGNVRFAGGMAQLPQRHVPFVQFFSAPPTAW